MITPESAALALNGWEFAIVEPHDAAVTSFTDSLGKRCHQAECPSCRWTSKTYRQPGPADRLAFIHAQIRCTYNFGFSRTNPLLERALRAMARSGFTFDQACAALARPWPHYVDERSELQLTDEICVFDARGIGTKSVAALIEAQQQGVLAHLGEPEVGHESTSDPAPLAQANDIATT